MSPTLFASMFLIGIATSVHCISMCGPMVVTYAVKTDGQSRWTSRVTANVVYQAAKLASYVLVGLVLGAVGTAFNLNGVRPWVMLAAGVFMVILGLGMTGKAPWAVRITPRPPRALINTVSRMRRRATAEAASGDSSLATPASFGLLTGLMPCAPLMAAELTAASSGSVLGGGFIMLAFGLGTVPLLFAFGTASSLVPGRWKKRLTFALAFVVIAMGLVFLNRTAMILDFPINAKTVQAAVLGTGAPVPSDSESSYTTAADGVVEVRLSAADAQFTPANLQIPAGRPVRLIVDRPDANPCSEQLLIPGLDISKDLIANGTTTIDLPASDTGSFNITCGMGMMASRLIVGAGGGGGGGSIPALAWLAIGMVALLIAIWSAIGIRRPARRVAAEGVALTAAVLPVRRAEPVRHESRSSHPPSRPRKKRRRR